MKKILAALSRWHVSRETLVRARENAPQLRGKYPDPTLLAAGKDEWQAVRELADLLDATPTGHSVVTIPSPLRHVVVLDELSRQWLSEFVPPKHSWGATHVVLHGDFSYPRIVDLYQVTDAVGKRIARFERREILVRTH